MANNVDIGEISWEIKASADSASKSLKGLSGNISGLKKVLSAVNAGAFILSLKKIGDWIGKNIQQTNNYIETLNKFRATMGASTTAATEFVDQAERLLGLDAAKVMDSLSSIQNLAEGFGLANDRAYIMSKNLTQLAADMSSFLNIPMEEALRKVKSGLAGELEPMRAIGVALDKATLQQTAYTLGIQKSYNEMTRAEKAELLYYQMMTRTTTIQGDLARTVISPANALRILKAEFTRLARAVGSIFIPMLLKIIPVVRAVTQILTEAASAIAKFFKFNISDYAADISNVGGLLTGISDDIGDIGDEAADTTKKLNKMLMPFDELNNVSLESASGGSGSGNVGIGGSLGIGLPEYDMFASLDSSVNEKVERIKAKLKELKPLFITLAAVAATIWSVVKIAEFLKWVSDVKKAVDNLGGAWKALRIGLGLIFTLGGFYLEYKSVKKMLSGDLSLGTILKATGDAFLIGLGIWMLTGSPVFGLLGVAGVLAFNLGIEIGMLLNENWDKIKYFFSNTLPNFLKTALLVVGRIALATITLGISEIIISIVQNWDKIKNFFTVTVPEFLRTALPIIGRIALGIITLGISEIIISIVQNWDKIKNFFTNTVPNFLRTALPIVGRVALGIITLGLSEIGFKIAEHKDQILNTIENIKNGISKIFNDIKNGIVGKIDEAKEGVRTAIERIKGFFNFSWSLPNIKTPHLYWTTKRATGWVADILSALNLPTSLPKLNIDWYANGGFPEMGQLFFANEFGPELVGNIGNKTAVANQKQITEGIAEATYNAFSRAFSENRESETKQPIYVNIGNERLYSGYGNYKNQASNMYGVNIG